jgi:uncharacterized surface protein with fasciclin (FAS1) repeats
MEAVQTTTPPAANTDNAPNKKHDIVDTAAASPTFSTITAALKAADLVAVLKETGPFTVFAPTDEAFAKLPAGALDELLKDKAKLAGVLTYHVVAGKILSKDVRSSDTKTVQGTMIKVVSANGGVTVNDAKVVQADIETTNGVIHGIDTVLMPK